LYLLRRHQDLSRGRYKELEAVQLWYCADCDRVLTPQRVKGKKYPLRVTLDAVIA
jgi:hypothetical protein